jgi:hypothetical protein
MMCHYHSFLIAYCLGVSCLFATGLPARAEWNTYQGNAAHTGYLAGNYDVNNFVLQWRSQVSIHNSIGLAVGGGAVYSTDYSYFFYQERLHAVDQTTGALLWGKAYPNTDSSSPPAYDQGIVYVQTDGHSASQGNFLYGYNAHTGASVSTNPYSAQWETYQNPTPFGGAIYMGGGYFGGMYAAPTAPGGPNWFREGPQVDQWTPAVDTNYAYFHGNGVFRMLNRFNGSVLFSAFDSSFGASSAVVLGDSHKAYVTENGKVDRWDTQLDAQHTPHVDWTSTGSYYGQPTLANGKIYVSSFGNNNQYFINALDAMNGNLLWSWSADGYIPGPSIATDNALFVTTGSNTYAIDLATHTTVWSYPMSGVLAVSDGTLYLGAADGAIYAFAVPEPTALALAILGCATLWIRSGNPAKV